MTGLAWRAALRATSEAIAQATCAGIPDNASRRQAHGPGTDPGGVTTIKRVPVAPPVKNQPADAKTVTASVNVLPGQG